MTQSRSAANAGPVNRYRQPREEKENVRDECGNDQGMAHRRGQGSREEGDRAHWREQGRTRVTDLHPVGIVRRHQAKGVAADENPEQGQPCRGRFGEPELVENSEQSLHSLPSLAGPSLLASSRTTRQVACTRSVSGALFPPK